MKTDTQKHTKYTDPAPTPVQAPKPAAAPSKGYVALPNGVHEFTYTDARDAREKRLSAGEKLWICHLLRFRNRQEVTVYLRQDTVVESVGQCDRTMRRHLNKPHMKILIPRRIQRGKYGQPEFTLYDLSLVLAMLPVKTLKSMGVYERVVQKLSDRQSTVDIANELLIEATLPPVPSQTRPEISPENPDPYRTGCAATSGTTNLVFVEQQSAGQQGPASSDSKELDSKVSSDDDALLRLLTKRWPDGTALSPEQARRIIQDREPAAIRQQVAWLPARNPRDSAALLHKALLGGPQPWSAPVRLKPAAPRQDRQQEGNERVNERRRGTGCASASTSAAREDRTEQLDQSRKRGLDPPDPPAQSHRHNELDQGARALCWNTCDRPPAAGAYEPYKAPERLPSGPMPAAEANLAVFSPSQFQELLTETVHRLQGVDSAGAEAVRRFAKLPPDQCRYDDLQGQNPKSAIRRRQIVPELLKTAKERGLT